MICHGLEDGAQWAGEMRTKSEETRTYEKTQRMLTVETVWRTQKDGDPETSGRRSVWGSAYQRPVVGLSSIPG